MNESKITRNRDNGGAPNDTRFGEKTKDHSVKSLDTLPPVGETDLRSKWSLNLGLTGSVMQKDYGHLLPVVGTSDTDLKHFTMKLNERQFAMTLAFAEIEQVQSAREIEEEYPDVRYVEFRIGEDSNPYVTEVSVFDKDGKQIDSDEAEVFSDSVLSGNFSSDTVAILDVDHNEYGSTDGGNDNFARLDIKELASRFR